jgi:predicted DNA binding CopG/RHH family protein
LKQQITIRLDGETLAYFRTLSEETEIPYQTLIHFFLRD